jgi:hypothetical protein
MTIPIHPSTWKGIIGGTDRFRDTAWFSSVMYDSRVERYQM